jgi:hypothetical protein
MLNAFAGGLAELMSDRFRATLAVMVWYLLTPPYAGPQKFDANAPLVKWYEAVDFESLADCQRYRAGTIRQYEKRLDKDPSGSRANLELFKASQCVSSDDARRTEK